MNRKEQRPADRDQRPSVVFLLLPAWLAAVLLLGGCGGSSGSAASGQSPTIGFSAPDLSNSFWVSMAYGIEEEAEKQGVEVVMLNAGGDANANQQISQLQDLVQRRVDAVIVGATNGDAVRSVVDQAAAQDIPVVGVSSIPNSDRIVSAVTADHAGMGKIQAECLGEALGGKGEVGMLAGPAGQSWADDRAEGFRETLRAEYPGIKVVTESRLADNRNSSLTTMEDWLQRFPNLDGVYTATDDIGAGAVDAIGAGGKGEDVRVTSSNFSPAAERLLREGSFECVSVQKIVEQGREAVRQAVKASRDEPVERNVVTSVLKLTEDNIGKTDLDAIRAPEGYKP